MPPLPIASPRVPGLVPADSLARLVRRDPFRLGRAPAPVPYDPARGDQPPELAPAIQRPTLALTGLVWGGASKSGALIEGLPGVVGSRLLQVGDTIGGIRVQRIGVAEVVLAGLDTMWTLQVRRPWD